MGIIVGVRKDGEHGTLNQLIRICMDSQKLKQQAQVLHWSVLGVLNICYGCWLGIFVYSNSGYQCAADFFLPALGTLFLLLGCLVQAWYEGFLLYLTAFCSAVFGWDFLEACPFLKRKLRGVDMEERWDGEELWREKGEETMVGMCCMRE